MNNLIYPNNTTHFNAKIDKIYKLVPCPEKGTGKHVGLSAKETKQLRSLINHLKHDIPGNHTIRLQSSPDAVTVNSKFQNKTTTQYYETGLVGYALNNEVVDKLILETKNSADTFKASAKIYKETHQKKTKKPQSNISKIISGIKNFFNPKTK